MHVTRTHLRREAFTIVELLIVVVVIAILATLVVIAYNGIQGRAKTAAFQEDLHGAANQLSVDNINNGKYPSAADAARNGQGIKLSNGATMTYTYSPGDNSYCLMAQMSSSPDTYFISSSNPNPTKGTCTVQFAGSSTGPANAQDGVGPAASFKLPQEATYAPDGYLYVTDYGGSHGLVRKIDPTTATVTTPFTLNTGAGAAGIAVAADGTIYIADEALNVIFKISGGVQTVLAGSTNLSGHTDGTGGAARFTTPFGLVLASDGNLYVADSAGNSIRKVTPAGVVTTLAGPAAPSRATGTTDGTGNAARFSGPFSIAQGSDGNLYVNDYDNNLVRRVTLSGVVTTVVGSGGGGYVDGVGTSAQIETPQGLTADTKGNLFLTDSQCRVRKIVISTYTVTTLGGGQSYGSYCPGIAVIPSGSLFVLNSMINVINKL